MNDIVTQVILEIWVAGVCLTVGLAHLSDIFDDSLGLGKKGLSAAIATAFFCVSVLAILQGIYKIVSHIIKV